jgi:hypothetical protein
MGSPVSGLVAEIFLHYYENVIVKHVMETNDITFHKRYMEDITIIFDNTKTMSDIILR